MALCIKVAQCRPNNIGTFLIFLIFSAIAVSSDNIPSILLERFGL